MSLKEKEEKIAKLEKKLAIIKNDREIDSSKIEETINDYKKETYSHLCAYDRVYLRESLNVLIYMSLLIMYLMSL